MRSTLAHNWWVLAFRGILAIAFGILAFLWPAFAWEVIVLTFAAFAFVDGVFAMIAALAGHESGRQWWALLLEGVL
ncbi:MAG TPA: DUF308 domain-containing protein, partial [Chthoniobacterales bacterium]